MVRFDRFAVVAALLLVGCASNGADSDSDSESASDDRGVGTSMSASELHARLHDPIVTAQLRLLTIGVSAGHGVIAPATIHAVSASDHQAAESVISGAEVDDHAPVLVVQAIGGVFTADHAPPGVAAPTGSVLTVSYDATTLAITDVGLDADAPDLAKIDADVIDLTITPEL
jgi:hypothetical protein